MASLPQVVAKASAVLTVSSLAVIGRTTSTSGIVGAGLKKCSPQTWSGRSVAIAISTTGRVDVLVARMASGLTTWSSSANSARLASRSSTIALDDQVAVDEPVELVGGRDAGERRVAVGGGETIPGHVAVEAGSDRRRSAASAASARRATHRHGEPRPCRHLGEPDPHDPGPDDPDRRDVAHAPPSLVTHR